MLFYKATQNYKSDIKKKYINKKTNSKTNVKIINLSYEPKI